MLIGILVSETFNKCTGSNLYHTWEKIDSFSFCCLEYSEYESNLTVKNLKILFRAEVHSFLIF